jgi:hypothetical protein
MPLTLDVVLEDHLIQKILCNDLEAVADRLPALPPLPAIRKLCDRIQQVTTTHFTRAETVLAALQPDQRPGEAALSALRQMHRLDETHAQDLVAMLWQQARLRERQNVEQLGYMLRCFFDGCRRAIALKESWIAGTGHTSVRSD